MKSKFVFSSSSLFIGLFLFFFTENVCSQESADNWTLKQARQWTQKQEWANGLKAMPHKTTDYQEFASQYHKNQKVWDKTFQWLATHDLVNMPAGRYEVDGEHCYINVQDATTQDVSKRKIEAHRHGIDCWDRDVARMVHSADVREYHPFRQYFQRLPAWDGRDRLHDLAVRVSDSPLWIQARTGRAMGRTLRRAACT